MNLAKKTFLSIVAGIILNYSQAQSYIFSAHVEGTPRLQYFNLKGEVVVDKVEKDAYPFSEDGVACVGQGRFVLINKKGEHIKTEIGEKVELKTIGGKFPKGYSDGLIIVKSEFLYGCLDTLGKIKFPVKYTNIMPFNNGHATARIESTYFILTTRGDVKPITNSEIIDVQGYAEYLAPYKSKNHKWGFVDTLANVVIPAQFEGVGHFSGGLAWARNDDGRVGFIDREGKWVVKPEFKVVRDFDPESGMATGTVRGTNQNGYQDWVWTYINAKGEHLSFGNPEDNEFSDGLAICRKGDLFGFLNNKGEWAVQPIYNAVRDFSYGMAWAKQGHYWGIIDKQNNWILSPRFISIKDIVRLNH